MWRDVRPRAPPPPAATTISTGFVGSHASAGAAPAASANPTTMPVTLRIFPRSHYLLALTPDVFLIAPPVLTKHSGQRNSRNDIALNGPTEFGALITSHSHRFERRGIVGFRSAFEVAHRGCHAACPMRYTPARQSHLPGDQATG